jgi:hypothetical protein
MKKASKYFNEIMLIALIAFIPMSMLSCTVEEVVVEEGCAYDSSIIGQYESYLNPNIVYTFTIDNWNVTQNGVNISDRFYCVTEDSTIGDFGYIKVENGAHIDYFNYSIVNSGGYEGIVIDGQFYQKK